jgi:hypothetical protein
VSPPFNQGQPDIQTKLSPLNYRDHKLRVIGSARKYDGPKIYTEGKENNRKKEKKLPCIMWDWLTIRFHMQHGILHNKSMIRSSYVFVESIVAAVNRASFPNDKTSMCLHHYN